MSDLVSCSRCGQMHPRGYRCNLGRIKKNVQEADKLRDQRRWKKKAIQIKEDARYLCEVCRDQDILNYFNLEVHHITKLRDDPDGLLEDSNLICLCTYHHKKADAGEIGAEYLRELAKKRIEREVE